MATILVVDDRLLTGTGTFFAEAEVIIYRIFQEFFTNIAKHAQAALVSVSIILRFR